MGLSHLHQDIKVYYQQAGSKEAGSYEHAMIVWGIGAIQGQIAETPAQIPQIMWTGIHKQKVI